MGSFRSLKWVFGLMLGLLVVAGCDLAVTGDSETTVGLAPSVTPIFSFPTAPAVTPTAASARTATGVPTRTALPTPTSPAAAPPLAATAIFSQVAPSVAFIDVPTSSGSGLLIADGFVLTNAHVVWPFEKVRVVFPDGSEYPDTPVVHWDRMADLALLGPIETTLPPLALSSGESLPIGSGVLLIGYPGEAEEFPQPIISSGVLSRLRESELTGITFLQADAAIAGGQSGGVLLSKDGEVIGITTFYAKGQFALAISAADALARANRLLAGEDVAGLGDRRLPTSGGQTRHVITQESPHAVQTFVINVPVGTAVEVHVDGEYDASFAISDGYGEWLSFVDDHTSGVESASFTTELAGPHFVHLFRESGWEPAWVQVSSNRELILYHDPDDNQVVSLGQSVRGNIDHPDDTDLFVIDLRAGNTITLHVDSVAMDPLVGIIREGGEREELVEDDDSGGGLLGYSAELHFRATDSGRYLILVEDRYAYNTGGYRLSVTPANSDVVPVTAPTPIPPPPEVDTPVGRMAVYQHGGEPEFSIQYPATWERQAVDGDNAAVFVGEDGGTFTVVTRDLVAEGLGRLELDEYLEVIVQMTQEGPWGLVGDSSFAVETPQGLPAGLLVLSAPGNAFRSSFFIHIHEESLAFQAAYISTGARHEELAPLIAYSFCTLMVGGSNEVSSESRLAECAAAVEARQAELAAEREAIDDAEALFDLGDQLARAGDYDGAIQAFTRGIELAPDSPVGYALRGQAYEIRGDAELAILDLDMALELEPGNPISYRFRASAYERLGMYERAIDDIGKAIEIEPNRLSAYMIRADWHWRLGRQSEALADVGEALVLDPDFAAAYNHRALIYSAGDRDDYDLALQDIEKALELTDPSEDEASFYNFLDTRAYIYLQQGQYDLAKADYDRVLSFGLDSPAPVLGAGLTHAGLGDRVRARELLERGLEQARELQSSRPREYDPQMIDLVARAQRVVSELGSE